MSVLKDCECSCSKYVTEIVLVIISEEAAVIDIALWQHGDVFHVTIEHQRSEALTAIYITESRHDTLKYLCFLVHYEEGRALRYWTILSENWGCVQ